LRYRRSNVGKSSLINLLANKKNLAKVSQSPGKTILINHFLINEEWFLVDLPGYGYARLSKGQKEKMEKMISGFLLKRANLKHILLLLDCRLDPQSIDLEFMTWLSKNHLPFTILFTKRR